MIASDITASLCFAFCVCVWVEARGGWVAAGIAHPPAEDHWKKHLLSPPSSSSLHRLSLLTEALSLQLYITAWLKIIDLQRDLCNKKEGTPSNDCAMHLLIVSFLGDVAQRLLTGQDKRKTSKKITYLQPQTALTRSRSTSNLWEALKTHSTADVLVAKACFTDNILPHICFIQGISLSEKAGSSRRSRGRGDSQDVRGLGASLPRIPGGQEAVDSGYKYKNIHAYDRTISNMHRNIRMLKHSQYDGHDNTQDDTLQDKLWYSQCCKHGADWTHWN